MGWANGIGKCSHFAGYVWLIFVYFDPTLGLWSVAQC